MAEKIFVWFIAFTLFGFVAGLGVPFFIFMAELGEAASKAITNFFKKN